MLVAEPMCAAGRRDAHAEAAERDGMRERLSWIPPVPSAGFVLAALQRVALVCAIVVSLAVLPAAGAAIAGYDTYVVTGGSMAPAVRDGSLVISRRVDPATVSPGDIITYRHPERPTVPVTHRVMQVFDDSGGRFLQTKGDANAAPDPDLVHADRPISRMMLTVPYAGWIISALRTLPGQVALVVLPALVLSTRLLQHHPRGARLLPASLAPAHPPAAVPAPPSPPPPRAVPSPHSGGATGMLRAFFRRHPPAATAPATGQPPGVAHGGARRSPSVLHPVEPAPHADVPPDPPRVGARPDVASDHAPTREVEDAPRLSAASADHLRPVSTLDTERIRRVASVARSHAALGRDLQTVEEAIQPVRDLLDRHAMAAAQLEANLDRELQPVRQYADALQANLDQLLARLDEEGSSASQALRAQFQAEQRRVEQVRSTMVEPRTRLRAAIQREAEAIDALLAGFDTDLDHLERTIADQRRDLRRITAQLQSDQFGEALSFLRDRSSELAAIAAAGIADAGEVEQTLRISLDRARQDQRRSAHLGRTLDALHQAVRADAAPTPRDEAV